jgi:hypothetical protein
MRCPRCPFDDVECTESKALENPSGRLPRPARLVLFGRMDQWLGRGKHPLAVPPDSDPEETAPSTPRQAEIERIIEQAREAVQ